MKPGKPPRLQRGGLGLRRATARHLGALTITVRYRILMPSQTRSCGNNGGYHPYPLSVCGLEPASGPTVSPSGWRTASCNLADRYQASRIGSLMTSHPQNRVSWINTRYQRGMRTGRCWLSSAARSTRHKATQGRTAGSRCCRNHTCQRCGGCWRGWIRHRSCKNRSQSNTNRQQRWAGNIMIEKKFFSVHHEWMAVLYRNPYNELIQSSNHCQVKV